MATKQLLNSNQAPDGSQYVTLTDGLNNLIGSSGPAGGSEVEGTTAAMATDSGNPIKVGAVFDTVTGSTATATQGQRTNLYTTAKGLLLGSVSAPFAPADGSSNNSQSALLTNGGSAAAIMVNNNYFNGTTWDRVRGDTNGAWAVSRGSANIATSQVSVGTSSTQIVAARANRGAVTITNLGTQDVFIGVTGVTTTTGTLLLGAKGSSITIPTNAAVFGVAAVAQSVSVLETF